MAVADDENAQVTLRALQTAKGRIQYSSWKGRVVLRKWPKKRGPNISANQQAWVDKFSAVSRSTKTPSVQDLENSIELAKGTGWYYRDVLAVAMNGKLWTDFGEPKIRTPTVAVENTSPTAVGFNTETPLVFGATIWNNNNFWDAGNPTVITIRSGGLYLIGANVQWEINGTGLSSMCFGFKVNGVNIPIFQETQLSRDRARSVTFTGPWYFLPGDELQVTGRQSVLNGNYFPRIAWAVAITPEGLVN